MRGSNNSFTLRRQLRPYLAGQIGAGKPSFGVADVFPSLPSVGGVLGGWTPGGLVPSGSAGGVTGGGGWAWVREVDGKSMKPVLQVVCSSGE